MIIKIINQLMPLMPFLVGSYFLSLISKESDENKKLSDYYFYCVVAGIVGARGTYSILNINSYIDNWNAIFNINTYNLSFIGGIVFSLFMLLFLSKKDNGKYSFLYGKYFETFYFIFALKNFLIIISNMLMPFMYRGRTSECAFFIMVTYLSAMIIDKRVINDKKLKNRGIFFMVIIAINMIMDYIF